MAFRNPLKKHLAGFPRLGWAEREGSRQKTVIFVSFPKLGYFPLLQTAGGDVWAEKGSGTWSVALQASGWFSTLSWFAARLGLGVAKGRGLACSGWVAARAFDH